MILEYNTLSSMNTFDIIDRPHNVNVLPCKWVYKYKDGGVYKSRLVPLGCNEIEGVDYSNTFAPVSKHTSVRMLLSISAISDYGHH